METRIDQIVGGIYRIATMTEPYGITFNQFLIDDERPTLIHTGEHGVYENVRRAVAEVLDPARLANIVLLHWEGDENGGMDRFMAEAPAPSSSARRSRSSSMRAASGSMSACAASPTARRSTSDGTGCASSRRPTFTTGTR
jgi:flavorubredoxin